VTIAEEDKRAACALTHVNVAGEVTVAVPDDARRVGTPCVVQTVVEGAFYVAQDPIDCLLVLRRWPLHEPAHVPDGERQVRPGVHQVAQAVDNAPVLCGINLFCRAVVAQLQLPINVG